MRTFELFQNESESWPLASSWTDILRSERFGSEGALLDVSHADWLPEGETYAGWLVGWFRVDLIIVYLTKKTGLFFI